MISMNQQLFKKYMYQHTNGIQKGKEILLYMNKKYNSDPNQEPMTTYVEAQVNFMQDNFGMDVLTLCTGG